MKGRLLLIVANIERPTYFMKMNNFFLISRIVHISERSQSKCFTYFIPMWIIFVISQIFLTLALSLIKMYNSSKNEQHTRKNHELKHQSSYLNDEDKYAQFFFYKK